MPITFLCPESGKQLRVKDRLAAKRVRCPVCGGVHAVPSRSAPATSATSLAIQPDDRPALEGTSPAIEHPKVPGTCSGPRLPGLAWGWPATGATVLLLAACWSIWFSTSRVKNQVAMSNPTSQVQVIGNSLLPAPTPDPKLGPALEGPDSGPEDNLLSASGPAILPTSDQPRDEKQRSGSSPDFPRRWQPTTPVPNRVTLRLRAQTKAHDGAVIGLAFSPNGQSIASSSADKSVKLWQAITMKRIATIRPHKDEATAALLFSPDGTTCLTATLEGYVKQWDAQDAKERASIDFRNWLLPHLTMAFSWDGTLFATGGVGQSVKVSSVVTKRTLRILQPNTEDRPRIIGTPARGMGEVGVVLGTNKGDIQFKIKDPENLFVGAIAFSKDNSMVAASTLGKTMVYELSTGKQTFEIGGMVAAAFSPDGNILACSTPLGGIALCDLVSLDRQALGESRASQLAFTADGTLIATAEPKGAIVWRRTDRKSLAVIETMLAETRSIAFSQDGKKLALGGQDGSIRLFEATAE